MFDLCVLPFECNIEAIGVLRVTVKMTTVLCMVHQSVSTFIRKQKKLWNGTLPYLNTKTQKHHPLA